MNNFTDEKRILSPSEIKVKYPLLLKSIQNVETTRHEIQNILDSRDQRFLMIIGPCSFHDSHAAMEYATKLKRLSEEVSDTILIVMRVYIEKPRTGAGWKGYINDPYINNTYKVQEGIINARKFMLHLSEMSLPIAMEILNPCAYLYFDDLLSWCTIGARTVESQPHREIASNLTIPLGFKNSTSGNIDVAINGIEFAFRKQTFIGLNAHGEICVIYAKGNPYSHLVLRGGQEGPNYFKENIMNIEKKMSSSNIPMNIIVDCSHGNSSKNYTLQEKVFNDVMSQKLAGNISILGVIIESFLEEGNQAVTNIPKLKYGCSITDACIGWEVTERIIKEGYKKLSSIKKTRRKFLVSMQ